MRQQPLSAVFSSQLTAASTRRASPAADMLSVRRPRKGMRQCHIQSVLCTLVVPVLLVAGCGQCPTDGRESPGDKREWSILQALEFRHRSVPITGLESQTLEGYEVIVVPGADNQQRTWIMLAPRHPRFYKQV